MLRIDVRTSLVGGLGLLALEGCGSVCGDDGLVWNQADNPACQQASATESESNTTTDSTTADPSATEPTTTMDVPTSTMGHGEMWCKDADGDGFGDPTMCQPEMFPGSVPNADDCADDNADAFPGAAEAESMTACMEDVDGDGWGDSMPPEGVEPGTDCADDNANAFPGAAEKESMTACMEDGDEDGWGDDMPPEGVDPGTDCNDDNSSIFPDAAMDLPGQCAQDSDGDGWGDNMPDDPEVPPGGDCSDDDPFTFPGAAPNDSPEACMTDVDGDDWGDATPEWPDAVPGTDCADDNPNAFPGAAENDSTTACMEDEDGDGWGDDMPPEGVDPGTDCDDTDMATGPGAAENEVDPDLCRTDADGDGWGEPMPGDPDAEPGSDCKDDDPFTFPGAAPNDSAEACMTDKDEDDWGDAMPAPEVVPGTDCTDRDPAVHENCAPCEPNQVQCMGDDLHTCNMAGNAESVVTCENGCDDVGLKCWDPLSVEAGDSVCVDLNMPAQLNAVAMGGDGMYAYNWTPAGSLDDATIANPMATPVGPTTYTIDVSDGEGNMASDSVTVYLKNQTLVLDPDICETYDFPDEADTATAWVWNDQSQELCQTVNGKSAALFCGWDLDNATITGTFEVTNDDNDDDWVGFMWGLQDTNHYYLFSWKRVGQNFNNCGGDLPAGMQVKVIDVADPMTNPQTCADRLQPADTVNSKLLVPVADFTTQGWTEATEYTFELTHKATGEITIIVRLKANNNVVAMNTFMDTTYASGKFGMYTKSQVNACFSNFVASCVP